MKEIARGDVARYCKASALDENGRPTGAAFQRRSARNEDYLSVYLLDFFGDSDQAKNLLEVKGAMERKHFSVKGNALFAVLNIERTKRFVMKEIAEEIAFRGLELPHAGIFHESDDLLISELLSECVESASFVKDLC